MILGVIPARGGSKGLPRKNILPLAGRPLIEWSIRSAQRSRLLDHFVVSTEDDEIATVAKRAGTDVSRRPLELASDTARTIDVLQDIAKNFPEAKAFVVLQPTSPLRPDTLIDECIRDYRDSKCDDLATGYYCKFQEFGAHNNMRRQDYRGFFYDDGSVYVLNRELVESGQWSGKNIFRKEIPKQYTYEIDDEVDFFILEQLIRKYASIP